MLNNDEQNKRKIYIHLTTTSKTNRQNRTLQNDEKNEQKNCTLKNDEQNEQTISI